MHGADLNNPDGNTLNADQATITGGVFMNPAGDHHFTSHGQIRLPGATISGQLAMNRADLHAAIGPDGNALNAEDARVDGPLLYRPRQVSGAVSFDGATVGDLLDTDHAWTMPSRLHLAGFTYRSLHATTNLDPEHRITNMVARSTPFSVQPYTQLAHTYRQTGNRSAARHVLWKMRWAEHHETMGDPTWLTRLLRSLPGIKPRPTTTHDLDPSLPRTTAPPLTRLARRLSGHGVGFGYRFWRPLAAAALLLAVGFGMFSWAARTNGLVPTDPDAEQAGTISSDCTSNYPCVQPLYYALDTLLPIIDLGANSHWAPDGDEGSGRAARNTAIILALSGWLIGGLTIAGAAERLRDPT